MKSSYTVKDLAEMLDISRRRVYQLIQHGIIERSSDSLYDNAALTAYLRHLRRTIAHYSGKTRGNPSPKTKPMTPERQEAARQRMTALDQEISEFIKRWAKKAR